MKKFRSIIIWFLSLIAVVVITIAIYISIVAIQEKLFVPREYVMWIFKYPVSRLIFIYQLYLILGFFYIFHKGFVKTILGLERDRSKYSFIKQHRNLSLSIFILLNVILTYTILTSVTVITKNKIIDYSFLSPQGKEYSYTDVVNINAGVHGKKFYLPFTHSKGDFFYVIELNDGTKIDLTELGGAKADEHEYFIIEKLDKKWVNMGTPKESSMENFKYTTDYLDKIYTEKIRSILERTK